MFIRYMVEQSSYTSLIQIFHSEVDKRLFFLYLSSEISPFSCLYLKMELFCILLPWKSGTNYSSPALTKNIFSFYQRLLSLVTSLWLICLDLCFSTACKKLWVFCLYNYWCTPNFLVPLLSLPRLRYDGTTHTSSSLTIPFNASFGNKWPLLESARGTCSTSLTIGCVVSRYCWICSFTSFHTSSINNL